MIKLNLHAHTKYSDGSNTLEEMVHAYRNNNFLCAVSTDHVYSTDFHLSLNNNTYQYQMHKAQKLSEELRYPVICGLEISCREVGEELILLGHDACIAFMSHRAKTLNDKNQIIDNYKILKEVKEKYKSYVILAHPFLHKPEQIDEMATVIDGLEIINAKQFQFLNRDIPKQFENKARYCNSDAHSVSQLSRCCNFLTENVKIKNDLDLIDLLNDYNSRKFQFSN